MDWQQIEEAASIVLRDGKLPTRSKDTIKKALASRNDPHSVLEALCVLDSLALNCGRAFRSALAAPKWMKRLTQCFTTIPQTAPAVAQLLANWELTFRGEELGASAHAARKQLQASSDIVPQPSHFAHDMREYFEQHIPFIGFQHGFDFLSAYSDADSSPSRPKGGSMRAAPLDSAPSPASQFQVGYLEDMSSDLHNLEKCAAVLQQSGHGPRPSHYDSVVRTGNALASKCCSWRACIQEWAADELLSYSLADMLVMNDRLHAELDRWEQVTQSLVLAQSMPMASVQAAKVEMPSEGTPQDHSQWFSPLGSSASRFTHDPPTLSASAPPAASPGVPVPGDNASSRDTQSTAQEEQAFIPGSAQQSSHRVGAMLGPSVPWHQACSISHRQAHEEAASVSSPGLSSQTRTGTALLGSWVAFSDAAQSALPPAPEHSETAWNVDPEQSLPTAQGAHTSAPAQPILTTAGIPAPSPGNASNKSSRSCIAGYSPVESSSSSGQAVTHPAAAWHQDTPVAMSLSPIQGMDYAPPKSVQPTQDADFDLLHWGGAHAVGQSASNTAPAGAAPGQGILGSMPGPAGASAMATSMQLPADGSGRAAPVRAIGLPRVYAGYNGTSCSKVTQPSQSLALGAEQASTRPPAGSSSAHHELQGLRQELAAERAARVEAQQQLESSRAREGGLQRQLAELEDKLRDREFQLWNAKLAAKQGSADDKGPAKQGTTHAIMAWCHQPALRVRFSAGQLEALAGRRELR